MHSRLTKYDVRHFRKIVLDILDAFDPLNFPAAADRSPECHFIHPVGLSRDLVRKSERLKHLRRSASDPVGLPIIQRTGFPIYDFY